ncbi:hypothetical protein DF3PA_20157 [Candidatus Defluviicoccus seviourii]|uniref:Uncharacterized protein n=1 Tax=Candidatus Defluviicoccus seviourii TaxID=2565273 RepID=A0A564WCM5_9PROT|nr:hypothetical protein DF3PA_20157 [Candidatus Defluviicoccus seviourii]
MDALPARPVSSDLPIIPKTFCHAKMRLPDGAFKGGTGLAPLLWPSAAGPAKSLPYRKKRPMGEDVQCTHAFLFGG